MCVCAFVIIFHPSLRFTTSSQHNTIQFTQLLIFRLGIRFRFRLRLWHSFLLLRSWDADDYNLFIYFNYTNFVDYRCCYFRFVAHPSWCAHEYIQRRIISLCCDCCSNIKWNLSTKKKMWMYMAEPQSLVSPKKKISNRQIECMSVSERLRERKREKECERENDFTVVSINYKWYYM